MCVQLGTKFGIHLTLEQWYRQYGPIYKFFLGKTPVVVVTGILHSLQLCATLRSMIVPMLLQILTYRRKTPLGCMHGNACECVMAPLHNTVMSQCLNYGQWPENLLISAAPLSCDAKSELTNECLSADPDLLKQLLTKSFMKFHDRPDLQMRLAEGDEITSEGMLAAKCAHLPFTVVAWLTFADH